MHAKRVFKDFKVKDLAEYHDLCRKSDAIVLAEIFKIFRQMCLKNYCTIPVKFL